MNHLDAAHHEILVQDRPLRRVREDVLDGVKVAAASVAASILLVLVAALLMWLVS